jgi:pilus assembly protein CpaB
MKKARIAILGVAAVAGFFAWNMASRIATPPPAEITNVPTQAEVSRVEVNRVLVAKHDIPLGGRLDKGAMEWADWPGSNISPTFIVQKSRPDALEEFDGGIATTPIYAGEPIKENVIARLGRGFMSAILPSGKRAISIRVQNDARAAGFILPNDRIDVILTRVIRNTGNNSSDNFRSETILQNVRILAIDQTFEERDGTKFVTGEIATLELTPREAELLALADQMGDLSLALRSIADIEEVEETDEKALADRLRGGSVGQGSALSVIKYGVRSNKN